MRADRINRLVTDSHLSINQIADIAEISPEHIWKLRNGKAPNVSAEVLARLAEALGVSVDYLLGMERDEHGLPVPSPEIVGVVARINTLPDTLRKAISRLIEGLLDFGAASAQAHNDRSMRLVRLLDQLSDEEYQQVVAEIDALLAGYAATQSPVSVPGRQATGTRSGE